MNFKLNCLLYVALSTFAVANLNAGQEVEQGVVEGLAEVGPVKAAKQSNDWASYLDQDEVLGGKFTTWLEFASDYVYRGTSETRDGKIPSIKGAITWTHNSGIYLGLYSANNLFPGSGPRNNNSNINALWGPYIGYSTKDIAGTGINYNGMVFQYMYPGSSPNNYAEVFNYVDKQFGKWNLKVEYTPTISDWFGVKSLRSHNAAFLPSYALPYGYTVSGGVGYQWFKNDGPKIDYNGDGHQDLNWWHWNIGVNRKVFGYTVDLRYHDTNIKKGEHDLYGNTDPSYKTVNQRLVIAVSKTF
jgi:uncharacterized protein (TIGR02001 family)